MLYYRWLFLLFLFDPVLLQEPPRSVLRETSTKPITETTSNQTEGVSLDPLEKSTTNAPQENTKEKYCSEADNENYSGIDAAVEKNCKVNATWVDPVMRCDEMLKAATEANRVSKECDDIVNQNYMVFHYKPRVYACHYCKILVDYMNNITFDSKFDHGDVVQVDLKDNEIGNLTCDLDWDAKGDDCIQKNAANLTVNCPNFSPYQTDDTRSHEIYCKEQFEHEKCMSESIDAMCGNETEKEYWQGRIEMNKLTIYACYHCKDLVDYMYDRHDLKLKVPQAYENHTALRKPNEKLEFAKTCPVTKAEKQNCTTENAEPLIHLCKDELGVHLHDPKKYCGKLLEVLECTNNHLEAICGSNISEYNVHEKPFAVKLEYCPYCEKAIDYLAEKGTVLYKENDTIPNSVCKKEDCNISLLEKQINETCIYVDNGTLQENCNKMYAKAKCAHNHVERYCGAMFAVKYMLEDYPKPEVYPCALCMELVTFMRKFNVPVKQQRNNRLDLDTFCPFEETFECVEKNTKWISEPGSVCDVRVDKDANGREFCSAMFERLNCTYNEIKAICGQKVSQMHMKSISPTAHSNYCQYCNTSIDLMERLGGHLYKDDVKGAFCIKAECESHELKKRVNNECTFKAQTSYRETCKELKRIAQCSYDYATATCSEYRAKNYTRDELIILAYPCIYCQEVIDFMAEYDGNVYQTDKNGTPIGKLTCPLSYNSSECATIHAKPLMDAEFDAFARTQFKRADEYCKDYLPTLESIYTQAEAVCGQTIANEYMKTSTYKMKSDACKYCKEAVAYMQRFGGHLYKDETGNPICGNPSGNPDGEEDDPNSAAEFAHALSYALFDFHRFFY